MEFMFTMIIVMLMAYSLVMIFRWTGVDLVNRRIAHEQKLTSSVSDVFNQCVSYNSDLVCNHWIDYTSGPWSQLDPDYYKVTLFDAIFRD